MSDFNEWAKQRGLDFGQQGTSGVLMTPQGSGEKVGTLEGMARSALWAAPQLIGIEPPKDLRQFQQESPWLTLASELPAYMLPYAGWAKLATLPRIGGAVEKLAPKTGEAIKKLATAERMADAPIKTGAARMVVQFAPFEAARVAAAATVGKPLAESLGTDYRGTGEVAKQAGLDLVIGGALGGVFGALGTFGKRAKQTSPAQIALRKLQKEVEEAAATGTPPADAALLEAKLNKLRAQVRGEVITKGRYVGDLGPGIVTKGLNRLFKPKITEGLERKILNRGSSKTYFETREEADAIMKAAGILGKEAWMQTPRFVKPKSGASARLIGNTIKKTLEQVDSNAGWYIRPEKGTGQYVMARKLTLDEGKPGWVLFKTDSPGQFLPEHAAWKDLIEGRGVVFGSVGAPARVLSQGENAPTEVYDTIAKFKQDVPVFDYRDLDVRKGRSAELAEKILKGVGLSAGDSELAQRVGGFVRNNLAPAMFQFTNSPRAGNMFAAAKVARDSAEALAEKVFLGKRTLGNAKTPLGAIVKGSRAGTGGIKKLIDDLAEDKKEWATWQQAVIRGLTPEEAVTELGLGEKGVALLRKLQEVDAWQFEGMNKIREAVGEGPTIAKPQHYMISRFWKGDWRVPIKEGHRTIGYASGKNLRAAQKEAEDIVEEAAQEGFNYVAGKAHLAGDVESEVKLLAKLGDDDAKNFGKIWERVALRKGKKARLEKKRTGAKFFAGDREIWTKDQVEKAVLKQLRDYQLHNAQLSYKALFQEELQALALEDPTTAEALARRVGAVFNEPGAFSKVIDETVDKVLSPVLGKNSATKIVNTANKYLFQWTLGFVNVGYNMANALTFVQTAYPQLAFLTTAAPERIAKYYTYWPVDSGKTVEALGTLDFLKITKQSFRELARPTPQLMKHFERGAVEGVWDPKFVEAFVGESTERASLKRVLSGEEPFSNWLEAIATWMPGQTEKFARGQAFSMGHIFFRDVMGVTDDDEMLYQLTKQFVEKTQFLYSTGDRARIITGPLGSSFGLFKNWVMHQIGWMSEFTGEAVLRGNWKPLGVMVGGTTAIGGIGALPLYGALDALQKPLSDNSLMVQTYEMFGENKTMADVAFYGFPAMLGFSIQNQVSAPFADPWQDAARLMSFAWWDRMQYAGKALAQGIDHWATTGESPLRDERTRDLAMRAFAPKMLYRSAQAWQDSTLKSLSSGYPVAEGLSLGERMFWGLGGNPKWVQQRFDVARELWGSQEKRKAAVTRYGREWASLVEDRDYQGLRLLIQRALYEGVDVSSVVKSGKSILAKGREDMIERQFTPEAILKYRQIGLYE